MALATPAIPPQKRYVPGNYLIEAAILSAILVRVLPSENQEQPDDRRQGEDPLKYSGVSSANRRMTTIPSTVPDRD
jgi:hypothetical protein